MAGKDFRLAWDDLRLVKAIADAKGMPGAAAALQLNHSTIFRRLGQIEQTLGTPLFERRRTGYALTPTGEEMTRVAAAIEEEVSGFTRKIAGQTIAPAGEIRVATADTLLIHLLTPIFARFQRACSDIRLDVVIGNQALNLSKRDADVAIRATDHPPDNLVGRRIGRIAWALYGLAENRPVPAEPPGLEMLKRCAWVSLGDEMSSMAVVRFARENIPPENVRYRSNTVLGLAEAVEAGLGIGHLPCLIGDTRPGLARLAPPEPAFTADLWLLTHPDLRHSPRIRVFMEAMGTELTRLRPLLEGKTGIETQGLPPP